MKKVLSLILAVVMVLSVICLPVSAADTVKITIGTGKQFADLLDAFDEIYDKQYTNVTFEIYGKQVLVNDENNYQDAYIIGSSKLQEVHFVGMTADAEIFVDDSLKNDNSAGNDNGSTGLDANTAGTVTFKKLIIGHNKAKNPVVQSYHRYNTFWYVKGGKTHIYSDCTFTNIMLSDAKDAQFKNCTFKNTRTGGYSIFYRGGGYSSSLTLENCTFEAPRGVKLYTDGAGEVITTIKVTGCTFAVVEKGAFDVDSAVATYADVEFKNNTFNYCKPVNSPEAMCLTNEYINENNYFNKGNRPDSSLMYTGSEIKYYMGENEITNLTAGEITAKTTVKNNWKVDLPVTIITAEYEVSETGIKTLVQTVRTQKTIPAETTEELSNTITVSKTNQRMVKTIVMPADFAYPISTVERLIPQAEITASYVGSETDKDGVPVHTYRIESNGFDYGDA